MMLIEKNRRLVLWPLLALLVGLIVTVALVMQARHWADEQLSAKLEHEAQQLAARMQQQFALQEEALRGLVGVFAASDEVTRQDFRAYVDLLKLRERFPAALEFRFARRVTQAELPAWQRQVARSLAELGEAVPDLSPRPPGRRDEYRLVEYVTPFSPASLGLDLLESPRRAAIEHLRAGQGFALSERLSREYPDFPAYALMAALPPKGEEPLPGTVALLFRPDRLVDALAREAKEIDVEIYDAPSMAALGTAVLPIFDTHADKEAPHAGRAGFFQARLPLVVGDRQWTLVVTARPDWTLARQYAWFPWVTGAGGVFVSLLGAAVLGFFVRRQLAAETRLLHAEADLERAQAVAEIGSWHLDDKDRLLWSRQTYRMFGIPAGEPLDYARFLSLVHPEDRDKVDRAWQAARQGAPYRIAHRIVVDGAVRWVEERAEPTFAADGHFEQADGTVRDITREKAAEEALRQLNAELEARVAERTVKLEQLLAERQEFLATMSHEIRTPLTGLLGMLELLSLTTLDADQRHELAIARESGKALSRIIDDILDYSKIEAGKLSLSLLPESLKALIESVRDAYLPTASAKGLSLMSFVDPRLPAAVVMDGMRVRQILQNFVSNALKFTAEGYVELRAERLAGDAENVTLKLAVRDSGIGIASEVQQRLFERYTQADATTARRYGGTGLGLAICKHLADLMGGTIGVESQPARGSTFFVTLTLPVAEAAAAPAPASTPALRQLDSGGRPVLVADDHPTNRALIARQMQILGLPVELAENGNQALAKWKHGDYALILTDVHMPVMDGFELAQAVRATEAQESRKHTPILAWTAAAMGEEVARAHAAGMDDVLVKPTELAELRRVLARWLPFAATNGQVSIQASGAVLDHGVLGQLAEGAEEEQLILADFLHQTRSDLAALAAAVQSADGAAAAREAHRIKGASRMVGASRLAARAARAEDAARRQDFAEARARLNEMETDLAELAASCGLAAEPAASAPADAPPVWDGSVLADMVGEAPTLQREMIESFFTHAAETLSEVRMAYEKREARPLARAAHKLKSAARAIGALELAELAARLEVAGNNADWAAAETAHQALDAAWARLEQRFEGGGT
ncbi:MAG: ATP-binding protein [Sulfuricella sp.]|nr:ATP-binding protein [Sulfuricella sp.]